MLRVPNWLLRSLVRAGLVLVLGLSPWPGVREGFGAAFRATANIVLGFVTCDTQFGRGHATLLASAAPNRDGPSWDTLLRLTLDRAPNQEEVFVNPRRILWIPLVLFLALVVAAPVSRRDRCACLAIGVPTIVVGAIAGLWTTALWLFAQTPGLLRNWAPLKALSVDLAYRALVVPLSNRYIFPLVLAGVLLGWRWAEGRSRAAASKLTTCREPWPFT